MTQRRLRQANLFGPAGFVSADDGEVIELSQKGFEQKPFHRTLAELGGTRGRRHRPHGHRDADPRHVRVLAQGDGGLRWRAMDFARLLRRWSSSTPTTPAPSTRATGTCGPSSSSTIAATACSRARTTSAASRSPRSSFESKGMLKDRVYGIRETLFHDPYYQRHVVGAPRGPRRSRPSASSARPTTRCSAPSSTSCRTVFNVGRYLDVVVRTPAGLKFAVAAGRLRQRDDPELHHLSDLRQPRCDLDRRRLARRLRRQRRDRRRCRRHGIALYHVDGEVFATGNRCTHGDARCATASSKATRSSARCTRASSTCAPARRPALRRTPLATYPAALDRQPSC